MALPRLILSDLRAKAAWCYGNAGRLDLLKVLLTDGTLAMILYRLAQWSRRHRLSPLEIVHDVPDHATVVGVPAQVVRRRTPEPTALP